MTTHDNGRIAVSTWSFHTFFERDKNDPAKVLWDVADFADMIADRYGVHSVEIVLPHLGGTDSSRLREVKGRLAKAGSRLVNMPLDYGELWNKPSISSTDRAEREHALNLYKKGIDVAAELGSPTVRADPGQVNLEDPSITIESYRQLAAYAGAKGIALVVENHGDIARHPEVLVSILQRAGVGSLPDIGNFPDDETRHRGLALMFPLAGNVAHAKMREGMDFERCVGVANDAGFKGVWSIEASGKTDPFEEVQTMAEALRRYL